MTDISSELASKIVDQLQRGTCPLEGVVALNVGREDWFKHAAEILRDIEVASGSTVRFIRGDNGEGKTHFIAMVRALAIQRNWVTTYVCLSDEIRLDRFHEVYGAMVRNCMTNALVQENAGMLDPGQIDGWRWILDDWISRQRRLHSTDLDFGKSATLALREKIVGSLSQHLKLANPVGDFAAAVRTYVEAALDQNTDLRTGILRWFKGEPLKFRPNGVLQPINKNNSKQILRSLVAFIRAIGYGGLAIFVDEIESVIHYPGERRRSQAYQNLRELLDNVDGTNGMQGACFYCAAVPQVFDGATGFREYEPLRERVFQADHALLEDLAGMALGPDYRAVVIDLAKAPLTPADYESLARKIRLIHSRAFNWPAETRVPDDVLQGVVERALARYGSQQGLVRTICETVVAILNRMKSR